MRYYKHITYSIEKMFGFESRFLELLDHIEQTRVLFGLPWGSRNPRRFAWRALASILHMWQYGRHELANWLVTLES